jgi:hypothetical protein
MAEFKPLQGMVTSNVRGSTYHPKTAEELQTERMQQQRGWQIEEDEDRKLQIERHKAFETIYRPMLENEARTQWATGHMGGRATPGWHGQKRSNIYSNPVYGRPDLAPPQIPMRNGVPVYGGYSPDTSQVQKALDTIWGRTRAMETAGFRPQPNIAFAPTHAAVFGVKAGKSA